MIFMSELRFRKFFFVGLLIVAVFLSPLSATASAQTNQAAPKLLRQCPGGKLYQVGGQRLLLLSGTPYGMGFAHGKLLAGEIKTTISKVLIVARGADALKKKNYFADSIEKAYKRLEPFIPPRYQEEMRGLADGAALPLKDVQLANIFPALFHCSGFAIMGKATRGGRLLHGRVLDYMTHAGLQDQAVTIIAAPIGYNAFVNISYAGFIGSVTGMNDKQIAIGEMGGKGEGQWDGMPMPMLFRKALEEADTLDQAVGIFRKTPRTCEYYYVISDAKISDARGLYCTGDKFVVLKPGEKPEDELAADLPDAIEDAVVFSSTKRLKLLLARIKAAYGKIDHASAIELMSQPVAMKSNLHNVLFAPASRELWVAHAASDPAKPKYQACFQKYQHYNVAELMKLMPKPVVLVAPTKATTAPTTKPKITLTGIVPANISRPVAPADSPEMAKLLKRFDVEPAEFKWSMKLLLESGSLKVHSLWFPSPYKSPAEENNTVHCEYFRARGHKKAPAVIVLHISDGKFVVARIISQYLSSGGVNALLLKMPYYGPRKPKDKKKRPEMLNTPSVLVDSVAQAVMDIRRAARWLSSRREVDADRIGICGVSLGGFVAAVASGVDGNFPRVALVLAGGDLPAIVTGPSREVRKIRRKVEENNWTIAKLTEDFHPIEPLTYASRLAAGGKVLMINAKGDKVVPIKCAEKLADKSGAVMEVYRADHYSMIVFVPMALKLLNEHFWPLDIK